MPQHTSPESLTFEHVASPPPSPASNQGSLLWGKWNQGYFLHFYFSRSRRNYCFSHMREREGRKVTRKEEWGHKTSPFVKKLKSLGQWDDWVNKGTCHQAWAICSEPTCWKERNSSLLPLPSAARGLWPRKINKCNKSLKYKNVKLRGLEIDLGGRVYVAFGWPWFCPLNTDFQKQINR